VGNAMNDYALFPDESAPPLPRGDKKSDAMTTELVFWTKDGKLVPVRNINSTEQLFSNLKFSDLKEGKIQQLTTTDEFGNTSILRSRLKKVRVSGQPDIAYLQVFSNVNQIQRSTNRSLEIIVVAMVSFGLLSIVVSLLLAHLSMKPILASWHKQQEFVENASHELRTPLAVIQNKMELLFAKPEETIIEHSEEISDSLAEIRRLRQLTTDLLTLARSDIENFVPEPVDTNVAEMFASVTKNYQLLGEMEDKSITFEATENFPTTLSTDPKLIKQLLVILLDNAIKYTENGDTIHVKLDTKGKNWSFSVADTGVGIPDDKKKTIFERFTRVDSSRNRKTGGFGLGLSIASQIMTALNAKIVVVDHLPKGTVFKVSLPL
jgi:two-component system sensor histidine kinase CiaH